MIDELKPYPKYKNSGLLWCPRIPSHWDLKPNRALIRQRKVLVGERHSKYTLLSLTKRGIIVRDLTGQKGKHSSDMSSFQEVHPGDLVMCLFDVPETPRTVGRSDHFGMITGAYTVFEANDLTASKWLETFYIAMDDRKLLSPLYSGLRNTIPRPKFLGTKIPCPTPEEQLRIVKIIGYLNKKVNHFIHNRRRLIEVLNEQKQAIINQAVIRGVDPDTPLKTSGVDWLGDIPAEWEVLRGKYLFREVDTRSQDGREPHLSISQKFGLVPASQLNERHFHSSSYAGGKLVHRGDIVLNRLKAHLGVFRLAWQDGVISPDYTVFRPLYNNNARYFELVLRSSAIRPELSCRVKGLVEGFWRLYTDDFYNIQLPVPPAKDQLRIVESCQVETAELDAAIRIAQREVKLIREYRTRLISEVVTGKIDVRHLAPQAGGSEDLEEVAEALDPLEDVIADDVMDDEEEVNEPD